MILWLLLSSMHATMLLTMNTALLTECGCMQVLNRDPDSPQGRIMSDSTSMFILYVLELLRWNGDTETLRLYYPTVRRAALWQMNVSSEFGVPLKLETTYDILQFPKKYQLSTYASVVRAPVHPDALRSPPSNSFLHTHDVPYDGMCMRLYTSATWQPEALFWWHGSSTSWQCVQRRSLPGHPATTPSPRLPTRHS